MRKLILLASFLIIAPLVLILDSILLLGINSQKNPLLSNRNQSQPEVIYAALPQTQDTITTEITENDARIDTLKKFLEKYNSPLLPFAQNLISVSDKYNLDYRLLPSIAMQESNLCKKIPKDSYNCWGFGIYGKKVLRFNNYNEAMEAVAKNLEKNYTNQGLNNPEDIMAKYTPSNNGSWARSVNFFMDKLSI